jgi:NAD(P)-dependent dehydrogenase (short-subunit alcohol dehydrogenase family)
MDVDPFSLEGKNILITGASSGIGRATAIECSKSGALIFISGRNEISLQETLSLMEGSGHKIISGDLYHSETITKITDFVPQLDGCVLNAGINKVIPLQFITKTDLDEIFGINTFAPILLLQSLVKKKKLNKGSSVVFTSSIAGVLRSSMANSIYSASKGAINGFMKNAALELAAKNIRVNSVNPAMVETDLIGKGSISTEQYMNDMKQYPLQRYGKPEEIAFSIIYLLSDASSWVTGSSLIVDGGITLR